MLVMRVTHLHEGQEGVKQACCPEVHLRAEVKVMGQFAQPLYHTISLLTAHKVTNTLLVCVCVCVCVCGQCPRCKSKVITLQHLQLLNCSELVSLPNTLSSVLIHQPGPHSLQMISVHTNYNCGGCRCHI